MRVLPTLLSLILVAGNASAATITYVHTGFGSGTLAGTPFGSLAPVEFTITAIGDTANVLSCGATCRSNDNISASVAIDGLGTFAFMSPTRYFAAGGGVGFSRGGPGGLDLFDGPLLAGDWDMLTSVTLTVGTGFLTQWAPPNEPVLTTGGTLVFRAARDVPATFAAFVGQPVPEPTTLLLLGSGLAVVASRRLRKPPARRNAGA